MKLEFVGPRPVVSPQGVSFDLSKPDSYTFLSPLLDMLEALEEEKKGQKSIDLTSMRLHNYKNSQLIDAVKKYCTNLDETFATREARANERIDKFIENIKEASIYGKDNEAAFLGNIAVMRNYYLHYVTNERVYHNLLEVLADKVHTLHFDELVFPIGNNHGLVLSHLVPLLKEHRPPHDTTLSIEDRDGINIGKLNMNRD